MKISEIGEFGLIEKIKRSKFAIDKKIVIGIGDDTAVIKRSSKKFPFISLFPDFLIILLVF